MLKDKVNDEGGVVLNATWFFRAFLYSFLTISLLFYAILKCFHEGPWNFQKLWMIFKRYMKENKADRETGWSFLLCQAVRFSEQYWPHRGSESEVAFS